jgi:hypothetical protein
MLKCNCLQTQIVIVMTRHKKKSEATQSFAAAHSDTKRENFIWEK